MNINRFFLVVLVAWGVQMFPQHNARAQDPAPAIPLEPQSMNVHEPQTPFEMFHKDAMNLVEKHKKKIQSHDVKKKQGNGNSHQNKGISRTVLVSPPQVTNASKMFKFQDVTDRSEDTSGAILPMSQRKATVESYRKSLVKE